MQFFLSLLILWGLEAQAETNDRQTLCETFVSEYNQALKEQLNLKPDTGDCANLTPLQLSYTVVPMPESAIEKVSMTLNLWDRSFSCELDRISANSSEFSQPPTLQSGQTFYFPAGGKGCLVTDVSTAKSVPLIKKFSKYEGKSLKEIIGPNQNLTFYYPNNMDIKVTYANGGSLYTPFAFTGTGTTFYLSADKEAISRMLFLTGMAPVTFMENGVEYALVMLIVYNFHTSGVGPYAEFQVAPVVQSELNPLPPFNSLKGFLAGINSSPSKGLAKSYDGKISLWQNHLLISSYDPSFAELAIKGGRGVSYPKYLAQQQQQVNGRRLTTWATQTKTAVSDEFQFKLTAVFSQAVQSLQLADRHDQALRHATFSATTDKWCQIMVQTNSKDSIEFAEEFEPQGILQFMGTSTLAKRLNAMRLQPRLAQISKEIFGATWTVKRDCGPAFYDEPSFMNPIP
jgi:hypothetical protein